MQRFMLRLVFTLALLGLAAPALAQPPTTSGGSGMALLNLDNTVALHGYDPVAYFTRQRAVKGNRGILERVGGATYYFASRASRYTFLKNAPGYQPQFGGYCTTSMAQGRLEDIDPEVFAIFEGKLYLFKDDGARARFLGDPRGTIAAASHHYFEKAQQQRSSY
ncbi:MAG: YHS domain protein [Deltaproteobacteria bacterium]|nr:YHS domain protein [Deltaproteobacteria bacterium]